MELITPSGACLAKPSASILSLSSLVLMNSQKNQVCCVDFPLMLTLHSFINLY